MSNTAEVIRTGGLDMQVCVPQDWTDEQVIAFAEKENPSGTNGWTIRSDEASLKGDPVRNPCKVRPGSVHITLDA